MYNYIKYIIQSMPMTNIVGRALRQPMVEVFGRYDALLTTEAADDEEVERLTEQKQLACY